MLKTLRNKFYLFLYMVIGSIILELVNFIILDFGFFPHYFMYDLTIVVVLAMVVFIMPHYITQYVLSTIILGVQALLIYANYSLYMIYTGDLFSFDMMRLLKEAAAAVTSSFVYFSIVFQIILVFLFIAIIGFLLLKYCLKDKFNIKNHFSIATVFMFLGVQMFSLSACAGFRSKLSPNNYGDNLQDFVFSDSFYMYTDIMKENSFKQYGTYGFYLNMLFNTNHSHTDTIKKAAVDYFNKGDIYSDSNVFGVDKDKNVIVIMMESLEWFAFEDGNYNFPTGQFSNELTPNIYGLITGDLNGQDDGKKGIVATNFFAKSKTNISESYALLGNFPVGQNLLDVLSDNVGDGFDYALPNTLKQNGYLTNYVHSNTITFYDRNLTHKQLGFDQLTGKESLQDEEGHQKYFDMEFHHWLNEETFVNEAMDNIVPTSADEATFGGDKDKFFTFYLNVSTHGPYKDNNENLDQVRYKNFVKYGADDCILDEEDNYILNPQKSEQELTYTKWYDNVLKNYGNKIGDEYYENNLTNQIVNYMSGVKGLDAAIGAIVKRLEDYQILDDTIMLLYSDHYAYYDSMSNSIKDIPIYAGNRSVELNTIPFILVSPGLQNMKNVPYTSQGEGYLYLDSFCSAYDIIPTILDLLGIKFNSRLYLGNSIFNPVRTTYKVMVDNQPQVHTMNVYYSNIGGLYCQDLFTSNLEDFIAQNDVDEQVLLDFINHATEQVVKVFYLDVLNNNRLFSSITHLS